MHRWQLPSPLVVLFALALILPLWLANPAPLTAESTSVTSQTLLGSASADETKVSTNSTTMRSCQESAVYVEWSTGVTAGVVTVETAFDALYTGTWAPLQVVTYASGAPKADIVQITGIHGALQTRISTAVSGGTVTTRLRCN